jgi:hypothetical protein
MVVSAVAYSNRDFDNFLRDLQLVAVPGDSRKVSGHPAHDIGRQSTSLVHEVGECAGTQSTVCARSLRSRFRNWMQAFRAELADIGSLQWFGGAWLSGYLTKCKSSHNTLKLPSRMRNSERRLINRLNYCGPWDHRQILPGYPPAVQGDRPRTKKALSDTTGMGVMLVRSVWTVTGSTSTEGHIRIIAGHPQSKKIDHLMPWRFRKTSSQH